MEAKELSEKVNLAREAVKQLEEPLKSKAFEIILNKLLNERMTIAHSLAEDQPLVKELVTRNTQEDPAEKITSILDSTSYPALYGLRKVLDVSLYILFISKNDCGIDGLTSSQVSKILVSKFRVPTAPTAISMALMKAGNLVDRRKVDSVGGPAYAYRIMKAGEDYINKIIVNPVERTNIKLPVNKKSNIKQIGTKKPKTGLNERISFLHEEKFFEKPKEAAEVVDILKIRGFHYDPNSVRVTLLRLVKRGRLRRIREVKDNQEVYLYCNP